MQNNTLKTGKNQLKIKEIKEKLKMSLDKTLGKTYTRYEFKGGWHDMVIENYEDLFSEKMHERIRRCGRIISYLETKDDEHRLGQGQFCNNRFCPLCSTIKARQNSYLLEFLMEHIKKENNYEFIFLTLTVPNVKGEELNDTIKHLNKSFERLMKLKSVSTISKGYIRKLEVTYQGDEFITKENKKKFGGNKNKIGDRILSYDTYHPHIHAIIAVNKSYFKAKEYIKQEKWLELWKQSTRNNTITQVDVRKAKFNNNEDLMELATYSAKTSDLMKSPEVFKILYHALKGKQLLVFGGIFKDTHIKLKSNEIEIPDDGKIYITQKWFADDGKQYVQIKENSINKKMYKVNPDTDNLQIDEMEITGEDKEALSWIIDLETGEFIGNGDK